QEIRPDSPIETDAYIANTIAVSDLFFNLNNWSSIAFGVLINQLDIFTTDAAFSWATPHPTQALCFAHIFLAPISYSE
ncbi:MAG: hypothetical protein KDE47_29610, partial [Caldilineaceae bacterium]|nr:hypothetical protein [Caldilineaceae bacterium]